MSTTTALELLEHADGLTRCLRKSQAPATSAQWETFDDTLYRLLIELVGIDAEHVRTADPSRRALDLAIRSYPTPLRPPVDARLQPSQAARYQAVTPRAVRSYIRRGHLRAVKDGDTNLIHSRDLDAHPDLRPADPTDPHPLAKLSCALGAMADLVHEARTNGPAVLTGNGEVAGATLHVLSLAAVAARHNLARGHLDEAVRPLTVGRFAERVIDALRDVALHPASLDRLASTQPVQRPVTLNDQLEAALHYWGATARAEINRSIPSVDVLRQIANQGTHLCDVRALLDPDLQGETARDLRENAAVLAAAGRAWHTLTTLTRPSHEFVTASRELHETISTVAKAARQPNLDPRRASADLDRGLVVVGQLMALTRSMPERLVAAGVLRGPAKSLRATDDRLAARAQGRYVKARPADAPDLAAAWLSASTRLGGRARLIQQSTFPQLML